MGGCGCSGWVGGWVGVAVVSGAAVGRWMGVAAVSVWVWLQ